MDNPFVRASKTCPLCLGDKPYGLLACWDCYNVLRMDMGNREAEENIARRERILANIQKESDGLGARYAPMTCNNKLLFRVIPGGRK